jgi:hypothetical protein
MPAPRNIIPTTQLCVRITEPLKAQLDLLLYSAVEGRVPKGKHQEFITQLLNDYFNSRRLDLAPFMNGDPGVFSVRGSVESIDMLKRVITGDVHANSVV